MAEKKKKSKKKEDPVVLTKLMVKGFKCFRDKVEIDIKPLTVLAGANSSGKTSMIQPLLLLKQTLLSQFDSPDPLLIDGLNVSFSEFSQIFWNIGKSGAVNDVIIGLTNNDYTEVVFHFNINSSEFILEEMKFSYRNNTVVVNNLEPEPKLIITDPLAGDDFKKMISDGDISGLKDFFSMPFKDTVRFVSSHKEIENVVVFSPFVPVNAFFPNILSLLHLPGLRGNPKRTYPRTRIDGNFSGFFNNYIASIITHWYKSTNITDKRKLQKLETQLKQLSISSTIVSEDIAGTRVSLSINLIEGKSETYINIADVGFGVSQVLPVLVALIVAKPGQIVYIEQPEIHLHPRAQVLLAEIIAEAAKRKVIVIIETHSDSLLLGIRRVVAKGKLDSSLISLNWFKRGKINGVSQVTTGKMDEKGRIGNWPEDFSAVSMKYEDEYLRMALDY